MIVCHAEFLRSLEYLSDQGAYYATNGTNVERMFYVIQNGSDCAPGNWKKYNWANAGFQIVKGCKETNCTCDNLRIMLA